MTAQTESNSTASGQKRRVVGAIVLLALAVIILPMIFDTFIAGPTDTCACNDCRYMKMNTIEKLRDCLRDMSPQIEMPEDIRLQAYAPIKRMLEWSK